MASKKIPQNQGEIDKEDQDRVEGIATHPNNQRYDPTYKGAYEHAVDSVTDQINRLLLAIDKTDRDATVYCDTIREALKKDPCNLLNLKPDTPAVQVDFIFTRAGKSFPVTLDYDNPSHDPAKENQITTALVGKEIEAGKQPKWVKGFGTEVKHHTKALDTPAKCIKIYAHFGWTLPLKDSCLFPAGEKKDLLGHAYITFGAMDMRRAARPENMGDPRLTHPSGSIGNFGATNMSCTYIVHRWNQFRYKDEKSRIDLATTKAEGLINTWLGRAH